MAGIVGTPTSWGDSAINFARVTTAVSPVLADDRSTAPIGSAQ